MMNSSLHTGHSWAEGEVSIGWTVLPEGDFQRVPTPRSAACPGDMFLEATSSYGLLDGLHSRCIWASQAGGSPFQP